MSLLQSYQGNIFPNILATRGEGKDVTAVPAQHKKVGTSTMRMTTPFDLL